MIFVEPEISPLSRGSDIASIVSAIVAVVSLMVAFYQFRRRTTQDETINGLAPTSLWIHVSQKLVPMRCLISPEPRLRIEILIGMQLRNVWA
jgi:hypothetical protein